MMNMHWLFMIPFFILLSCSSKKDTGQSQPNILWLTCEDISPTLPVYGDSTAQTPTLDKLAGQSLVYDNAFTVVGVCAPSRSCLITGMYPTSIGTHNMRTGKDISGWGSRNYQGASNAYDINGDSVPLYSTVIPENVKCFTEYLRAAGYYCTNNAKTDYQFAAPVTAWDENGSKAHWKNRDGGQPFFAVFNHNVTHESRMWMNKSLPMTVDTSSVPLPPYFPDHPVVRQDVGRNYSNIELLDQQLNERLQELEEAGLLDNTIVFFFSDHGGPLPRGKREHYDSGLKVPFMVRMPGESHFERVPELVSFVDFAPTVLSLAGIKPPEYMQGQAFLGKYKREEPRRYIFGSGDRFDEFADRIRIARDKRYLYVRNYHPELPAYKDVAYRKQMDMMNVLLDLHAQHKLNAQQKYYFRESKTREELYDCWDDPYQLNNLIDSVSLNNKLNELRTAMDRWQEQNGDKGSIPELELFYSMWPDGKQPVTQAPIAEIKGQKLTLKCATPGASIGFIVADEPIVPDLDSGWQLYHKPVEVQKGQIVYVLGVRVGYRDSDIEKIQL